MTRATRRLALVALTVLSACVGLADGVDVPTPEDGGATDATQDSGPGTEGGLDAISPEAGTDAPAQDASIDTTSHDAAVEASDAAVMDAPQETGCPGNCTTPPSVCLENSGACVSGTCNYNQLGPGSPCDDGGTCNASGVCSQ